MSTIKILKDDGEPFVAFESEDIVALFGIKKEQYRNVQVLKILLIGSTQINVNPIELQSGEGFTIERLQSIHDNIYTEWKKQSKEVLV